MEQKKINRWTALSVFAISFAAYFITMAPGVLFWDVGELCTASFSLQVPHAPGAPLFLLLMRIAAMVPLFHEPAARMHLLCAAASGLTCTILYGIIVKLLLQWRDIPVSLTEKLIVYGSGFIGSLSLAFSKTFWQNAVQTNIQSVGVLLFALVLWLGVRWYTDEESENNSKLIFLLFYVVGLSAGVHLLSALVLLPLFLLWYDRFYTFSREHFAHLAAYAFLLFLAVVPGVVSILPSFFGGELLGMKSSLFRFLPPLVILAALCGIYECHRRRLEGFRMIIICFLFVVLGSSTSAVIFIRAQAHPPLNEANPSSLAQWASYTDREESANMPVLNRRWSTEPEKQAFHKKYTSDLDYFLSYQTIHMYLRYLGWNEIGCEKTSADAGIRWRQFFLIPALFGLFGLYKLWRTQRPLASALTLLFFLSGLVLAWAQNQQGPQPREFDFLYGGSFLVFSIWIGIGISAAADLPRMLIANPQKQQSAVLGVLSFAFFFVPVHKFIVNYASANGSGSEVASDYAYNLLQSCEKNAILVTNGDNDTFPLWYLQSVDGVRQDVRIVNLTLLNTSWYALELKHDSSSGARPVAFTSTDAELEDMQSVQFEPQVIEIPVDSAAVQSCRGAFFPADSSVVNRNVLSFYMPNTIEQGTLKGLRPQDVFLLDIVRTSAFRRPIYFASSVPPNGMLGLRSHLQITGLAYKLVPYTAVQSWPDTAEQIIAANLFGTAPEFSKLPRGGFSWRGFRPGMNTLPDETVQMVVANYRSAFFLYAMQAANVQHDLEKASRILDRMEEVLPRRSVGMDYRIKYDLAAFYHSMHNRRRTDELLRELVDELKVTAGRRIPEPLSGYNPYIVLFTCYLELHQTKDAEGVIDLLRSVYGSRSGIEELIAEMRGQIQTKQ
jgi:hypothetical protein